MSIYGSGNHWPVLPPDEEGTDWLSFLSQEEKGGNKKSMSFALGKVMQRLQEQASMAITPQYNAAAANKGGFWSQKNYHAASAVGTGMNNGSAMAAIAESSSRATAASMSNTSSNGGPQIAHQQQSYFADPRLRR